MIKPTAVALLVVFFFTRILYWYYENIVYMNHLQEK